MGFKQRTRAALAAVLFLICIAAAPTCVRSAAAEEADAPQLDIAAASEPGELAAPGEVLLSFTLTNRTSGELESVCLSSADGLMIDPIGTLSPGESQTYARAHAVTQAELDAGALNYIVTCVSGSDHFSYPVEIPIQKNDAEPQVEFLRRASSSYVTDSGSVTLAYEVRNTGNVAVSALSVADPLGSFDGRIDALDVGERRVFIQHVSLTEDGVSSPVLTYSTAASPDSYTARLDDLTIHAAQGGLDASITAGRSMFDSDTAEVILRLDNTGSVDYEDVVIYDDIYGGVIADSIQVPAGGEPVEISHAYPIRSDSSYRWRVTGGTSAGDQIDFVTNTASVYLDADAGDPLLTLKATPAMTRISRKGYVPVTLEIANVGDAMATAVQISEASEGELCELAVIPLGDATVYETLCAVRENTALTFSAVYLDRYGQPRTATSDPVEIVIGPGGQTPLSGSASNPILGGFSSQIGNSSLFMGLLIGSCAVIVVLIVILLVTSRRARMERRLRAAARRQRLKEEKAKTARFTPLRTRDSSKK